MKDVGAKYLGSGKCKFTVWAPLIEKLSLHILSEIPSVIPLTKNNKGYFQTYLDNISPGDRYLYQINNNSEIPDPASYFQPEDVMGPSCIVDHDSFQWNDHNWCNIPLERMVIYELHIGTFTSQGTFNSAISQLDDLVDLGITAIEIMPVAQFPGDRNWGYDGVYPFAVQHSYGGPDGLKAFVDTCHRLGIAVILDVVYNHLGPEGNFLPEFMPCFTDKYKTPWGNAINYDDTYSFGVRNYFIQNAIYWFEYFHIDALRLDAVHGIFDMGAKHFLKELSESVSEFSKLKGRKHYLIAESDLNDTKVVLPYDKGGYAMDAQWSDDFHHALHTILTKEQSGYYEDFGNLSHFVKAIKEGFVYSWDYSKHRRRYHGSSSREIPAEKLVVCLQNHDQIGNRLNGERTSLLLPFEALKLAAASVILSPFIPLLFMGEEYGEESPFLYFMSFYDKNLINGVREGRKKEFSSFNWEQEPPDPYSAETFIKSKLNWHKRLESRNRTLLSFYKKLIDLRKKNPVFMNAGKKGIDVQTYEEKNVIILKRRCKDNAVLAVMNFGDSQTQVNIENCHEKWCKVLCSSDSIWQGPGTVLADRIEYSRLIEISPFGFLLYESIKDFR